MLWWRLRRLVSEKFSGQAILAIGGGLLLVVLVVAMLPDRIDSNGAMTAAADSQAGMVNVVLPGLTPFTPTTPIQFVGRVTQVASIGSNVGWGQVHIWIDDGTGMLREISVAPQSYLARIGCSIAEGARVSGTGFQFDMTKTNAELYAKMIIVGGQTCRLRDDEGLALWLNPVQ